MECIYSKFQVSTCRTVETALVSAEILWRTFVVPLRLYKKYREQLTPRLRFLLGPLSDRIVILNFRAGPLRGWKKAEIAAPIPFEIHTQWYVYCTARSTL